MKEYLSTSMSLAWLVERFNSSDFLSPNAKVQSLEADFYCPQNDTHERIILQIGKDVPILDNYNKFNLNLKNKAGIALEMDFEPSEYFYFISSNIQRFKEGKSV